MKTIQLGRSGLDVPTVAIGCMRINRLEQKDAATFIRTALEAGANFFDHADIYGAGACESQFAAAIDMNSTIRESMILQSNAASARENSIFPRTYSCFCGW